MSKHGGIPGCNAIYIAISVFVN